MINTIQFYIDAWFDFSTMTDAHESKLLTAGELDARYLKLLKRRGDDEEVKFYDLKNVFKGNASPTFDEEVQKECQENLDSCRRNADRKVKWGSISRQLLQPEDPRHQQPQMRKKKVVDKEELFATTQDAWLTVTQLEKGSLLSFFLFTMYLSVCLIILYGGLERGYDEYATALSKIFTHTSFNTSLGLTKTFPEIRTVEQFWDFIEQVFLKVFYGYSEKHTRSAVIDESGVFWLFDNILVGIPRMRQLRVQNGSCHVSVRITDLFSSCYGYFSDEWIDKEPFGFKMTPQWKYSEPSRGSDYYGGKISTYSGGGYIVNFTSDGVLIRSLIQELKEKNWVQRGARAIFLDFTTYTPNTNLFTIVKLVFELPPTGGMIPTSHFHTMKFLRYVNTFDYVILGAEMGFVVLTIWYTVEEILEVLIERKRYFLSLWNLIDIAILIAAYTAIFSGIVRVQAVNDTMKEYVDQIALKAHQPFESLLKHQQLFNKAIAAISLLVWMKLLRFTLLFRSMAIVFSVFGQIKSHVFSLSLLIFTTVFGFALVASMLYGSEVTEFTTTWNSFFTLIGLFFGGMYFYPKCEYTFPNLTAIFFLLYIFTIFVLMVNIYIALVVHGLRKVVQDLEDQRERKYIGDILEKIFRGFLRLCCMKTRAEKLVLAKEKVENKRTYQEVLRIAKKHGYRANALVILFQKHAVLPGEPIPFKKVSALYEEIDTWNQLQAEINEHDRLMLNVEKASRKVMLLDKAVGDMMKNMEFVVSELLDEEKDQL